jgi:hypothetical protein
MGAAAPLPVLLAHTLVDFTREADRTARDVGVSGSLLLWADLLRAVPGDGITVTGLPAAARISRRVVKAWLGLEKQGWLTVEASGPGTKVVRLAPFGRRSSDAWAAHVSEVERAWGARVGSAEVDRLRRALKAVVGTLDLELPHHPISYGPSDPRATGGRAVAGNAGPPRIPAHGTDWVPVPRTDPGAVHALALHALLSQALMAFTIDVEERTGFPMGMAAMLARSMPGPTAPLTALPQLLGVTGNGKSLLERHGLMRVSGAESAKIAALTPLGERVRDAHASTVAATEESWHQRHGAAAPELAGALAAVEARLPAGLPDHVAVRYVAGAGFADMSSTP